MLFIELLKVGLQSVVPVGRGRVGGPGSNAAPTAARAPAGVSRERFSRWRARVGDAKLSEVAGEPRSKFRFSVSPIAWVA